MTAHHGPYLEDRQARERRPAESDAVPYDDGLSITIDGINIYLIISIDGINPQYEPEYCEQQQQQQQQQQFCELIEQLHPPAKTGKLGNGQFYGVDWNDEEPGDAGTHYAEGD